VSFELLLVSTDTEFMQRAVAAGVDGIIVNNWEYPGEERRSAGADTQIKSSNSNLFSQFLRKAIQSLRQTAAEFAS
jgi:hypothetical protein